MPNLDADLVLYALAKVNTRRLLKYPTRTARDFSRGTLRSMLQLSKPELKRELRGIIAKEFRNTKRTIK